MKRTTLTLIGVMLASGGWAMAQDHPEHPGGEHPGAGGMDPATMQAMMAWQAYATPGEEQAWLGAQAGTFVTNAAFRVGPSAPRMESEGGGGRGVGQGGRFLV